MLDAPPPAETAAAPEPTPPSASEHPCEAQWYSQACAQSCEADAEQEPCNQVCLNHTGVEWCEKHCRDNVNLRCRDFPRKALCPVFQAPMWRVAVRAAPEVQFRDIPALDLGAEILIGVRTSASWSIYGKLRGTPLGIDFEGSHLATVGGEVGVEHLWFAFRSAAVAVDLGLGAWLPSHCRNSDCPFALPMTNLATQLIFFGEGDNPQYRGFSGWSLGVEGGAGYDPFLGEWLGRAGLTWGIELAFK